MDDTHSRTESGYRDRSLLLYLIGALLLAAGLGIAFRAKPLVKQSAEQSISTLGLDAILYLLGFSDRYQSSGGQ